MRKNDKKTHWNILGLLLLVSASWAVPAIAKEPPKDLQPLEDIPPPPLNKDGETTDEPQITIVKKKNGDTVEEYRMNGQLYMMKVTPAHGVPYYMHREDQEGGWLNDGPNQPLSVPKWILFRF
ncbi:MAG TPA: DUF2782 domain-containing protein [Methylotenera sp.]|nr:DUF2782 domain-containing protein [Methylotenera sp.]